MTERPPELSERALAALAAYRDATPMPDTARDEVHARLTHAALARPAWLWVGVGAIAAGLLLWGGLGVSDALRPTTDADNSQAPMHAPEDQGETAAVVPAVAPRTSPRPRQGEVPQPATPTAPAPLEELEAPDPPAMPEPAAATPARAPSRRSTKPAPPTPPEPSAAAVPASRLGAENRLMTRTWDQVRTKQYAKARKTLAEHAKEFPSGVLAPERRALTIIVGCLQHPESAAGKADAYAASGRGTLLAKVRSACDERKSGEK